MVVQHFRGVSADDALAADGSLIGDCQLHPQTRRDIPDDPPHRRGQNHHQAYPHQPAPEAVIERSRHRQDRSPRKQPGHQEVSKGMGPKHRRAYDTDVLFRGGIWRLLLLLRGLGRRHAIHVAAMRARRLAPGLLGGNLEQLLAVVALDFYHAPNPRAAPPADHITVPTPRQQRSIVKGADLSRPVAQARPQSAAPPATAVGLASAARLGRTQAAYPAQMNSSPTNSPT